MAAVYIPQIDYSGLLANSRKQWYSVNTAFMSGSNGVDQ